METLLELYIYFIAALIGAVMHIIKKFAKLEGKRRKFNPLIWWGKHKWTTILGIMLSLAGVLIMREAGQLSFIACLLMGYAGDSITKGDEKQ